MRNELLTRRPWPAVVVLVGALLVGCGPGAGVATPEFRTVDCPGRIAADVLIPVTCGYIMVPERHADPSGPHIQLFVARVVPQEATSDEPALYLGYDIGGTVEYGSIATLAPRIHREVIILDSRGTGFSRPHLGCPEVAARAPEVIALPSGAQAGREAYRSAVRTCRERLVDGGLEIAAYGLDEIANDVDDVMAALDVPAVGLHTGGTSSLLLTSILAAGDDAVRSAVLDGGPFAELPDEAGSAAALVDALVAADALCDDACVGTGRPAARLTELADLLDQTPLLTTTGDGVPLLLDGPRLRGIAAWLLERHRAGARLTQELAAAAEGRPGHGPLLDAEQVLCLGQRPKCDAPDFSYGVWWTVRCQQDAHAGRPFGEDVCAEWQVAPPRQPTRSVASAVPLLALYGALDPYLPEFDRVLPGMSRRTVVLDPSRGRDVAIGCLRPWRDRWVDDPAIDPEGLCPGAAPPVTGTRTWDD